ncbi:MAG: hypothetical protein M3O71_15655 [Bacteroidota bacterium]|nr:hypothetical protein [Bacteroidota bacterium]
MGLSGLTGTFVGYVKQLNTSLIDKSSCELIDDCFPNFTNLKKVSDWINQGGLNYISTSKGTVPSGSGRMRRYSGGNTLPRGRYYSVCFDSSGNDGGTLFWELMSYWNAQAEKYPELIDSTVHKWAKEYYQPNVDFELDKPFLILKASNIEKVIPNGQKASITLGKTTAVVLPLIIKRLALHKVLDLRNPNIQDRFTKIFGDLEMQKRQDIHMMKEKPRNFFNIMRTLLSPDAGGYAFHEGIAAYCRNIGIEGLIFPSARRNSYVKAKKTGEILSFDGWNFVDFRDAPPTNEDYKDFFGLQPKWLRISDTNIHISLNETKEEREWLLYGIEEAERLRYDVSWCLRANNRQESLVWNERTVARERNEEDNSQYITLPLIDLTIEDKVEKLIPQNLPDYLKQQINETISLKIIKNKNLNSWKKNENILNSLKQALKSGVSNLSTNVRIEESSVEITIGEILLASLVPSPELYFEKDYNLGESWFFYRLGTCDAEIQIRCPACDDQIIWPVLRGYILTRCKKCGFDNNNPESPDAIRNRFLNWAKG